MRKKISVVCMTVGVLLIAAAITLAVYNRHEEQCAEDAAKRILPALRQATESGTTPSDSMTVKEIDGYGYIGSLSIPALELELPVMSEWDEKRLKIAPCLYYGSVKKDHMVIAAHNYTSHFGRLSKLKPGDPVRFTDMEGTVYDYTVRDLESLSPTATEEMIEGDWALSLYTCTYGGGSRLTVRCVRVESK